MSRNTKFVYFLMVIVFTLFVFYFDEILWTIPISLLSIFMWFLRETKEMSIMNTFKKDTQALKIKSDDQIESIDFKLRELIHAIPSPLVYINQKGGFEVQNPSFKSLIKIEPKNVYDISIVSTLRQIMLDAFLNEQQFIRRLKFEGNDYQVYSIPIHSDDRYAGCLLIFQDISSITDAEVMQKRFIADASHELKTPITSIKGMIEILNRPEFNDPIIQEEFLLQTEKEVKRLNKIVDDLLLQSHLKEKQVYLEKREFLLKEWLEELFHALRHDLKQESIQVKLKCSAKQMVYADPSRLRRVLMNLLNNAINYAPGGLIEIACEERHNILEIRIKDTGQGIPKESLPHIFDRFFRSESDRNRSMGGSGLGLAISKSIINAHGGSIEVSSTVAVGSEFIIKLTQN